jgi:prepilin-type N-terminal cleavage/methylation domain-containing protein
MKHGFTLIELLVYMVIMGFIIVVAGRVFSDSTSMRVRSQSMLKSSEHVGKVSDLIREDISQMGVKTWWDKNSTTGGPIIVNEDVYWDKGAKDSSSYTLVHGPNGFDSLVFKKAEFDDNGDFGIREISWAANATEKKLRRRCRTVSGTPNDVCPSKPKMEETVAVLIAENLEKFTLRPSKPGMEINSFDTLFPTTANTAANLGYTFKPRSSGNAILLSESNITGSCDINNTGSIVVSSFSAQNKEDDNNTKKNYNQLYLVPSQGASSWSDCSKMDLKKGETYSVQFEMLYSGNDSDTMSTQFLPGHDHIAVGFRRSSGNDPEKIPEVSNDVLFYPPQFDGGKLKRHAEFSVEKEVKDACVAVMVAFYSINKASNGKLRFKNFTVLRKTDRSFHFPKGTISGKDYENYGSEGTTTQDDAYRLAKRNVKAFELIMEIAYKGEKAGTNANDETGMVITTPNNGTVVKGSQ